MICVQALCTAAAPGGSDGGEPSLGGAPQVTTTNTTNSTASGVDLRHLESQLSGRPLDASQLYNDVAQPLGAWDVCLQLVHHAGGGVDTGVVRQLWDHALLATWQAAPGMGSPAGTTASSPATLEAVCVLVEKLGSEFYPSQSRHVSPQSCLCGPDGIVSDSMALRLIMTLRYFDVSLNVGRC
jgi:hypothetical protein